ncbi:sulfotransferase domain-containing protein [Maribellus comscasis]|nr:sulfotransferase domain-containing protein [Maribellus comscasis]
MKKILIYGLQRSGTNYLETLLKKKFKIKILNCKKERNNPLHKHFRLYNNKDLIPEKSFYNSLYFEDFNEFKKALNTIEKVDGFIIITKDPYSWLVSYNEWANKCNWTRGSFHYIEEYNYFYNKWMEFSREDNNVLFIRYIDLINSPNESINKIAKKINLKKKFIFINKKLIVKKVAQSSKFDQKRLTYYQRKKYLKKFNAIEIDEINKLLDEKLLDFLGYSKEYIN